MATTNACKERLMEYLATLDVRAMLMKTGFVLDVDADEFVADISADELTVAGYARKTLGGEVGNQDNTNDRGVLTATSPLDFGSPATGETIKSVVLYVHVTNDADSWIVGEWDLAADVPTNGAAFSTTIHADGLAYVADV